MPALLVLSALAGVLCGCEGLGGGVGDGVRRSGSDAPRGLTPINDAAFLRALETNARPLCESGRARTLADLAGELDRPAARTREIGRLPSPATAPLELPALYARRAPGVLVLALVAKCDHCSAWHRRNKASAFVLTADGVCVTCRHFFEHEKDATEGRVVAADCDGTVYAVTALLGSSAVDDIALFRIAARGLSPIPLRRDAAVGEDICVISHPHQQFYLLTRGIIARRAEGPRSYAVPDHQPAPPAVPCLNITAEYAAGSSGAPVLDRCGNAVGMAAYAHGIRAEGGKDGETQMVLRTCVPAERILDLLRRE